MRSHRRGTLLPVTALGCFLGLTGCGRVAAPAEFIRLYEASALQREERAGYAFLALYQSPDYMAAKQAAETINRPTLDSLRREFGSAHYVSLAIRMAKPTGDPSDMSHDVVNANLLQGQEAFAADVAKLRTELMEKVRLETPDGRSVAPVTYMLSRSFGLSTNTSFLFAFPMEDHGKAVPVKGSRIVVRDFGLNLGTLRLPLAQPSRLKLKVET